MKLKRQDKTPEKGDFVVVRKELAHFNFSLKTGHGQHKILPGVPMLYLGYETFEDYGENVVKHLFLHEGALCYMISGDVDGPYEFFQVIEADNA